jgi:hypothetical protein
MLYTNSLSRACNKACFSFPLWLGLVGFLELAFFFSFCTFFRSFEEEEGAFSLRFLGGVIDRTSLYWPGLAKASSKVSWEAKYKMIVVFSDPSVPLDLYSFHDLALKKSIIFKLFSQTCLTMSLSEGKPETSSLAWNCSLCFRSLRRISPGYQRTYALPSLCHHMRST